MARILLLVAAALGATGVMLGAFGAHALRDRLSPEFLQVWHTAVEYQMWHALAAFGAGLWVLARPGASWAAAAGWAWVAGVVLFSGSLYLLALSGERWLGAVTPVGGLSLIAGWALLAVAAWRF